MLVLKACSFYFGVCPVSYVFYRRLNWPPNEGKVNLLCFFFILKQFFNGFINFFEQYMIF